MMRSYPETVKWHDATYDFLSFIEEAYANPGDWLHQSRVDDKDKRRAIQKLFPEIVPILYEGRIPASMRRRWIANEA